MSLPFVADHGLPAVVGQTVSSTPLQAVFSWWSSLYLLLLIALLLWSTAEVLFFFWYRAELAKIQPPATPPKPSAKERAFILDQMIHYSYEYGAWRQVQQWFIPTNGDSVPHVVGREDLNDLLAWAFFYSRYEDLSPEEIEFTNVAWEKLGDLLGDRLVPGRASVRCLRHTIDNVRAIHRPLLFYLMLKMLRGLFSILLRARGFRRGRTGCVNYWHRLGVDPATETLVFFHGIGFGLVLYLPLLLRLLPRGQILFEMPWISMDPFARVPTSAEYTKDIVSTLNHHGVESCVVLGHSFGSIPASWLIRQHPARVARCILVDPVAVLLNLPDVCNKFLYKQPRSVSGKIMRIFGARELGIARTLMRHFYWTEIVLFPDMLPVGSSIILMGDDCLLPVQEIYACSKRLGKLHTTVVPGLNHGHFLIWPSAVSTIVKHVGERAVGAWHV
eukprot:NODE_6013_length_1712_cov_11.035331.p1 GENE.NODE_6013_length_1712_cov_11.035331~~NODE_6013_length_1712_cov_11.035331.p1  ORF type:complete len:445 (+),score=80.39 NODE_6013_length_1712_cov_11.035331:164-1498(+)